MAIEEISFKRLLSDCSRFREMMDNQTDERCTTEGYISHLMTVFVEELTDAIMAGDFDDSPFALI